jgi:hypothetical protein
VKNTQLRPGVEEAESTIINTKAHNVNAHMNKIFIGAFIHYHKKEQLL